jgi:hypothetical protein
MWKLLAPGAWLVDFLTPDESTALEVSKLIIAPSMQFLLSKIFTR